MYLHILTVPWPLPLSKSRPREVVRRLLSLSCTAEQNSWVRGTIASGLARVLLVGNGTCGAKIPGFGACKLQTSTNQFEFFAGRAPGRLKCGRIRASRYSRTSTTGQPWYCRSGICLSAVATKGIVPSVCLESTWLATTEGTVAVRCLSGGATGPRMGIL
jgi:hypothetical protein